MTTRASILAFCVVGALLAAVDANAISSQRVLSGQASPTYVTAPDGDSRLFVLEQAGRIKVYTQGGALIGTFLDISSQVSFGGGNSERGLLGLAFSPTYAVDRIFYVDYTDLSGDTRVSRFRVSAGDPNVAEPTEDNFLFIDQPFSNHNGGRLSFGPDGMLYISTGDGGSAGDPQNNGQNVNVLLGKMLRLDVSGGWQSGYTSPPGNPFYGAVVPGRDEIWAYGLRNPWGAAFDALTGDLYIADVGQNAWEEINVQPASSTGGENYGWRLMEGTHCYNPSTNCNDGSLVLPVYEYSHSSGCSITGGAVYRGIIPAIQGHYFFGDFCSARIWSFQWDGGSGITNLVDRTTELTPDAGTIASVSAISTDGLDNLYIVDRGSGANGEIFRIIDESIDVSESSPSVPTVIQAAPNPFRDRTTFRVGFPAGTSISLTIVDAQGRLVRQVADGIVTGGEFTWDGRDDRGSAVAAGVYFIRVEGAGQVVAQARVTRAG